MCCLFFIISYIYNLLCNIKTKRQSISEPQLIHHRETLNTHRYNKHLRFYAYLNDVKGFYPHVQELKNHIFRFKPILIESAQKQMSSMFPGERETFLSLTSVSNINNNLYNKNKKTLVSIHVRLGDYGNHLKTLFNLQTVGSSYFTRAMGYIVEREPASNYIIIFHTTMMQLRIKFIVFYQKN